MLEKTTNRWTSLFQTHPVHATAALGVLAVFATIFCYRKKLKSDRYMDMNAVGHVVKGNVVMYTYRGKTYEVRLA